MTNQAGADQMYRSVEGQAYLAQRKGAASDAVQDRRASLYRGLTGPDDVVLDFGCGTGGVLSRVPAARRIGVELGREAGKLARDRGLEVFESLDAIADNSVDCAISFHAIEHTENPAAILRSIVRVVKPGHRVRLIVPGENPRDPRQASWFENRDMHLYTWTPLIFGNLAKIAGFVAIHAQIAPMPTASRLVRALSFAPPLAARAHARAADRMNAWNVILDASVPE